MDLRTSNPLRHTGPGLTAPRSPARRASGQTPPALGADDVRAASRYLAAQGFSSTEAGNLVAYLHGLTPDDGGWTIDEIERLLFVRHLVDRQHLKS